MPNRPLDEERIFYIARKLIDANARADYLDQICDGDQMLRERLEGLLKVDQQDAGLLVSADAELGATVEGLGMVERPGTRIGRYRLREQIGEGGMGVVFVAEQERPIRRKVALKVIKPGMDSKAVVARFEAERQALAMMDHPNIAKVLDAGTTESGRPYFVMELVQGIPVTEYCDEYKLSIQDRLTLFIQVCQAVQHAHLKAIIHRDLKPSNVMVTELDGKPIPKVIDFGVSKALGQSLTEHSIYTSFQSVVGTPLYMSPEQASLSAVDVDTRSDVYSLGVLLYELLTGTTPFAAEELRQVAAEEVLRFIREREPPRPSDRISTLGETSTRISDRRRTHPDQLSRQVRGDLDWIVMRALEKDRSRRYKTADSLAYDIQRHLNHEAVEARPPSTAYRLSRFYRRNRAAIGFGMTLIGMLAIAVPLIVIGWCKAVQARREAEATLFELGESCYREAIVAAMSGDHDRANEALQLAREANASSVKINIVDGLLAINDGRNDDAVAFARQSLDDLEVVEDSDRIASHSLLAVGYCFAGFDDLSFLQLSELRQYVPRTEMDHLFVAYANLIANAQRCLDALERAPRFHSSPVGLLLRATARVLEAKCEDDLAGVEESLNDFQYVRLLFRNNQMSLAMSTATYGVAIDLARGRGDLDRVDRYKQAGLAVAKELERFEGFPGSDFNLWTFYRAIGDDRKASEAIRGVGFHPGTYSFFLAADIMRNFSGDQAADEFDRVVSEDVYDSKYVRLARAPLVRDLPDGERRVRELVADCLDDQSSLIRRFALLAWCLVGSVEEVEAKARHGIAINAVHSPNLLDSWGDEACIDYLAGLCDEDELWRRTGGRGFSRSVIHFTIAMKKLAAEDRDGAKERLQACADTDLSGIFDVEWARAYLQRMEDPNWPEWLNPERAEQRE